MTKKAETQFHAIIDFQEIGSPKTLRAHYDDYSRAHKVRKTD